jgi:transcription antitermination factor NusG
VIPRPIPLIERGQRVVVRSGPFSGVRGLVLETRATDRVLIQIGLSAIGQALKIELDADSVELVGEKDREQAK